MKKVIYFINLIALLITLVAYLTLFGGMMCQPFLGAIQVVSAILLSARWGEMTLLSRRHLQFYWILVAVYGLGWIIGFLLDESGNLDIQGSNEYLLIGYVFVIPMCIAIYFTWVTYYVHKKNHKREIVSDTLDEELIRDL